MKTDEFTSLVVISYFRLLPSYSLSHVKRKTIFCIGDRRARKKGGGRGDGGWGLFYLLSLCVFRDKTLHWGSTGDR